MSAAREVNFDGLIGPTHNFGGLSFGNLASMQNKSAISRPRAAALQGLEKMKRLMELGILQAVLPPQERPDVGMLRRAGFGGSDAEVLAAAWREKPAMLVASASASSMWAANAATVSPSADTADGRVHFTPANLMGNLHRSIEAATTGRIVRAIFSDEKYFAHHPPLPATAEFSDEGAANHTRLCGEYGAAGVEIFTYGRESAEASGVAAEGKFPARQAKGASEMLAREHQVRRAILLRQNPSAIEAGAFHFDVVAVGNLDCLICHAEAFADGGAIDGIRAAFAEVAGRELTVAQVPAEMLPLNEAVRTYLFNSQVVALAAGGMALIAPMECRASAAAQEAIGFIRGAAPMIRDVQYVNVTESMGNGGGPACLRLRVVLTEAEMAACGRGVFLNDALYGKLRAWVGRWYRETLAPAELGDPKLLVESRDALQELTTLLRLPAVYPFQL